jgi:alpha-ribazole phosphatase
MRLPDPGPATRMVLIRHAEAEDAYAGRCYGSLDVALSPTGHQHAHQVAERLADLPVTLVASSPRRRAMDTAAPIAARHGLAVEVLPGLREMDFGSLEGRTYTEIEQAMPELWHEWMTHPTALRFPDGESYEDLHARACHAVDTLRRDHPSQTLVVVAHGGVLRALLADALELASHNIFRLDQSYCAINVIDWFDNTPVIRIING